VTAVDHAKRRRRLMAAIENFERRIERCRAELAGMPPNKGPGRRGVPVLHGGLRFDSLGAAAAHEGVTPSAILLRIKRGCGGWRYAEDIHARALGAAASEGAH
jgi:hypothetical protein